MRKLINYIQFKVYCIQLFLNTKLFIPIFKKLALTNKVVFSNFFGNSLGDDPKYILEELLKRECVPQLVWVVKSNKIQVPDKVVKAKYGSLKYYYHLCTAKVWVFNIRNLAHPPKRKGQFYIQTWHATTGLKMAEAAIENILSDDYIKTVKLDSKDTDLMYTNNNSSLYQYKNLYWYDGPVVKMDVPRMGALINNTNTYYRKVVDFFSLQNKKIILYAPTFRKKDDVQLYLWDYEKIINEFNNKTGEQYVFLIRLHPNIAYLSNVIKYDEKIINASQYPDMQELLVAADVLITDFSSTMFEFAYLGKSVFLYAPDFEHFIETERNLFYKFEELPFRMNTTINDLCSDISAFDKNAYKKKCDMFYTKIGMEDHGHGAEMLSDIILSYIESGEYTFMPGSCDLSSCK